MVAMFLLGHVSFFPWLGPTARPVPLYFELDRVVLLEVAPLMLIYLRLCFTHEVLVFLILLLYPLQFFIFLDLIKSLLIALRHLLFLFFPIEHQCFQPLLQLVWRDRQLLQSLDNLCVRLDISVARMAERDVLVERTHVWKCLLRDEDDQVYHAEVQFFLDIFDFPCRLGQNHHAALSFEVLLLMEIFPFLDKNIIIWLSVLILAPVIAFARGSNQFCLLFFLVLGVLFEQLVVDVVDVFREVRLQLREIVIQFKLFFLVEWTRISL